jgi:hypothetical protein
MWRIWINGGVSDMVNLSRARDAAVGIADRISERRQTMVETPQSAETEVAATTLAET